MYYTYVFPPVARWRFDFGFVPLFCCAPRFVSGWPHCLHGSFCLATLARARFGGRMMTVYDSLVGDGGIGARASPIDCRYECLSAIVSNEATARVWCAI